MTGTEPEVSFITFDIERYMRRQAAKAREKVAKQIANAATRVASHKKSAAPAETTKTSLRAGVNHVSKSQLVQSKGYEGLPGTQAQPTGPDESWRRIAAARAPAFDHAVPAYLLDDQYWFLDWNPAFDELIARPLGLKRLRNHAEDFILKLENIDAVYQRSKRVFDPKHVPLMDIEPLVLRTDEYGLIEFQKIAVQIFDAEARLAAWSVYLNISQTERGEQVWESLRTRLENELNWSRYAVSYDKLLLNFDDYGQLVRNVVKRVAACKRCLDIGSGTGNATIELLRTADNCNVWAVESNHAMVQQMVGKIEQLEAETDRDYFGRLHILKEDVLRLDDSHESLTPQSFDAAILINVLYAVADPEKCLRDVYHLLRDGGKLVLSTAHRDSDVEQLFARMKSVLQQKGLFQQLSSNFNDARERNLKLDALIHRDTKQDIRRYLQNAGFEIVDWCDSAYVDSVVVVEAIKPTGGHRDRPR